MQTSRDVLDGEQHECWRAAARHELSRVEQQILAALTRKLSFHHEVANASIGGDHVIEHRAQCRDVPDAAPHLVQELALGVGSRHAECRVERLIGRAHAPLTIQHHEWLSQVGDDVVAEPRRSGKVLLVLIPFGDVTEDEHDAGYASGFIANRGRAVVDRTLRAIPCDQERMICEADDDSVAQRAHRRALDAQSGRLVDDVEHLDERLAVRLGTRPTRQ